MGALSRVLERTETNIVSIVDEGGAGSMGELLLMADAGSGSDGLIKFETNVTRSDSSRKYLSPCTVRTRLLGTARAQSLGVHLYPRA